MKWIVARVRQGSRSNYLLVLILLFIFLVIFPQFASYYGVVLLTEVFIYAIFALSLNLLLGYTGLPSLGHSAFFAVGGYAVAILVAKGYTHNLWLCLAVALVAATAFSLIFGFLALRSSGIFFLVLTFALSQFVWAVVWSWRSLTGGDDGLPGISRPDLGLPISFVSEINFYYLILLLFAVTTYLIYRICHSPFGYVLQGIRESETRMQVLGYNTWKYKFVCFSLAGIFGGLAGALKAYQDGFVSPLYADVFTSGMVLLMCLSGGTRVFIGPVIGAALIWITRSIVSTHTEYWALFLGFIFIGVVMFAPQGIAGYFLHLWEVKSRGRTEG